MDEALRGDLGRYLYCRLTLFCQSLQTFLRIILDITTSCPKYSSPKSVPKLPYVDTPIYSKLCNYVRHF